MVYITNGKLTEKCLNKIDNIDDILEILEIIKSLLKKYGRRIRYKSIQQAISSVDADLAEFIKMLNKIGKLKIKDISAIQLLLRQQSPNYTKHFQILANKNIDEAQIIKYLEKEFKSIDTASQKTDEKMLKVAWEGFYYKRDLYTDLDKLLEK